MPRTPLTPLSAFRSSGVVQQEPLLATKLYIPLHRTNLVNRPRLLKVLQQAANRKLILLTAPPGFGKTTLLSEWLTQNQRPTAWISLDEGDNDPARFLSYVTAALQMIGDDIGQQTLAALASPEPPSDEAILATLLNEVAAIDYEFVLVLDDYHVIDNARIHEEVSFLLDHMPPQMQVAIISRTEPALPLPRLRARGQLTELRAQDLRFTLDEVAAFLNEVMGLELSRDDIEALEARTEGWVASLQLAAISIQGRDDAHNFIRDFTGNNRYVLDYLAEEVLNQQDETVQDFLLKTSILDRLNAPLCNAVIRNDNGQVMLEMLEAANLFVVPLDDRRRWYRYHHLFRQFLREKLHHLHPDLLEELHKQAADWYEAHNFYVEAVSHALAVADYQRTTHLVERVGKDMLMRAEITTLLNWLQTLPEQLIQTRPRLCLIYAWALAIANLNDAAEARLKDAENMLGISQTTSSTVLRRSTFLAGPTRETDEMFGEVVAIRTILALRKTADIPRIIRLSLQALDRLPSDNHFLRGVINLNLASAYWYSGQIDQALDKYTETANISLKADSLYIALLALGNLADLQMSCGQLYQAQDTYQQFLSLAVDTAGDPIPMAGWAYLGLSQIAFQWDNLEQAEALLYQGIELIEDDESIERVMGGVGHLYLSSIRLAQGDTTGALEVLKEAESLARKYNLPQRLEETDALRAQVWIQQRQLAPAERWSKEYKTDTDEQHSERRLLKALTLAQLRYAQKDYDEALTVIENLVDFATQTGALSSVINALVLRSLIFRAEGQLSKAQEALRDALRIGEIGHYIRPFTSGGEVVRQLLLSSHAQTSGTAYVQHILDAFEAQSAEDSTASIANRQLTEPLSERELDVLRKIAEGLSNREIAEQSYVALSTIKTHINNIYSKLSVRSRTQALARARELKLLE